MIEVAAGDRENMGLMGRMGLMGGVRGAGCLESLLLGFSF